MTTPDLEQLAAIAGQATASHSIDASNQDRAQDADHCTCGPLIHDWDAHLALVALQALAEHCWIVPKIEHDESASVVPIVRGGLIRRDEGQSDADHTRHYAAQLLAAADAAEAAR